MSISHRCFRIPCRAGKIRNQSHIHHKHTILEQLSLVGLAWRGLLGTWMTLRFENLQALCRSCCFELLGSDLLEYVVRILLLSEFLWQKSYHFVGILQKIISHYFSPSFHLGYSSNMINLSFAMSRYFINADHWSVVWICYLLYFIKVSGTFIVFRTIISFEQDHSVVHIAGTQHFIDWYINKYVILNHHLTCMNDNFSLLLLLICQNEQYPGCCTNVDYVAHSSLVLWASQRNWR